MRPESSSPLASAAALLGVWTMESPQFPEFRGRATIEWMEDGAYLAVRDDVEEGDFPSGVWIVGADDSLDDCVSLYSDSRGVRRTYQMSVDAGVWKIWRSAPEFSQRFTGQVADDRKTINAKWEMLQGNSNWETDFELIYRKIG
jgi:hypothetical protein